MSETPLTALARHVREAAEREEIPVDPERIYIGPPEEVFDADRPTDTDHRHVWVTSFGTGPDWQEHCAVCGPGVSRHAREYARPEGNPVTDTKDPLAALLPCEDPEWPCDQDGRDEHRWCDNCIARSVIARTGLTLTRSTGLREALEAVAELDRLLGHLPDCPCPGHAAINRLRAALARPTDDTDPHRHRAGHPPMTDPFSGLRAALLGVHVSTSNALCDLSAWAGGRGHNRASARILGFRHALDVWSCRLVLGHPRVLRGAMRDICLDCLAIVDEHPNGRGR